MIDLLGHLFYVFVFSGMLFLRANKKIGWILRLIGEVGWIGIGIKLGLTSVWVWGILFAVVDVLAYLKWNQLERN